MLLSLEEEHATSIRTNNDPVLGQPCVAEEVLGFDLLDGVGFQRSLVVLVGLENTVADNAELGVVVGVE